MEIAANCLTAFSPLTLKYSKPANTPPSNATIVVIANIASVHCPILLKTGGVIDKTVIHPAIAMRIMDIAPNCLTALDPSTLKYFRPANTPPSNATITVMETIATVHFPISPHSGEIFDMIAMQVPIEIRTIEIAPNFLSASLPLSFLKAKRTIASSAIIIPMPIIIPVILPSLVVPRIALPIATIIAVNKPRMSVTAAPPFRRTAVGCLPRIATVAATAIRAVARPVKPLMALCPLSSFVRVLVALIIINIIVISVRTSVIAVKPCFSSWTGILPSSDITFSKVFREKTIDRTRKPIPPAFAPA